MRELYKIANDLAIVRKSVYQLAKDFCTSEDKIDDNLLTKNLVTLFQDKCFFDSVYSFQIVYNLLFEVFSDCGKTPFEFDDYMSHTIINFGAKTPNDAFWVITVELIKKMGQLLKQSE